MRLAQEAHDTEMDQDEEKHDIDMETQGMRASRDDESSEQKNRAEREKAYISMISGNEKNNEKDNRQGRQR